MIRTKHVLTAGLGMAGVLFLLSFVASGCAVNLPRIQSLPVHVETQIDATEQNLKNAVGNLQQLLTMASDAMNSVSKIEDEAAKGGAIPVAADEAFDRAMLAYVAASKAASDRLVTGAVKTWPELRALVEPILQRGQQVIDLAANIGAIKARVMGYLTKVRDVLSAAAGEFLSGVGPVIGESLFGGNR